MQSQLRNTEHISEELNADYHQMQHFITECNWNGRSIIDQVSQEISSTLPKRKLTGLIIDESGWVKKGEKSIGWQYCGNVGIISNSQVAVFACLSNGDFASMADARFYLPLDWCNDPVRCREAGIPNEKRLFKTKLEFAFDIIKQQIKNSVSFDFIGGDGHYVNDASLANANLEQYTHEGLEYMQAQLFFVGHYIKESKQILRLDRFQTRKWLAWQHQVALNFLVASFILKEKLRCFDDLPLLSARKIKEMLVFKLYKEMTEKQMMDRINNRHLNRQRDINYSYLKT